MNTLKQPVSLGDYDYVNIPVPSEGRRNPWYVLSVWLGFIIVVGIMSVGGGLASQMSLSDLLASVVIGNFILGCFAALTGYIASESGESFPLLAKRSFSGTSWRIVALYPALALIGWYAIECAIFGNLIGQAAGLSDFWTRAAMGLSAILFSISTYVGFRALKWVSLFLVPTIIVLGVYAIFAILGIGTESNFGTADSLIGISEGLGPVIGSWALGVVAAYPDLARFCRNPKVAAAIGFIGIFIFNSLTILLGAAGAAYTGEYDPALILIGLGSIPIALILGIANLWTTNDSNLYSASIGLSLSTGISRKSAVIASAFIGLIVALFDPSQFSIFFGFLGFLGNTAPALGGVVVASYIFGNESKRKSIYSWLGWILGSTTSILLGGMYSVVVGFFVGFIIIYVSKFTNR